MSFKIAASFVHEYNDLDYKIEKEKLPALVINDSSNKASVHNYPFPRNISDFFDYKSIISGLMPKQNAENFKKLPRFGLTGLAQIRGVDMSDPDLLIDLDLEMVHSLNIRRYFMYILFTVISILGIKA